MEVPLEISEEKVPLFLDYLRLAIEGLQPVRGEGSIDNAGRFTQRLECLLDVGQEHVPLTWTIVVNPDDTLEPIVVNAENVPAEVWEKPVRALIDKTLVATINERKERFFLRTQFAHTGWLLDGEYYLPGFRLAPAFTESEDFISEKIAWIDLNVDAIDRMQANSIGWANAHRIASLLSLFLGVGFYAIQPEKRWVYDRDTETLRCLQLGYFSPTPAPTQMPKKNTEARPGGFRPVDRSQIIELPDPDHRFMLQCPSDIRVLFRALQELPTASREAYYGAAALYQIAVTAGHHLPSVRASYQVAAVDALLRGGQQTRQAWVDFVKRYCPVIIPDALLHQIYGDVRSAHFHGGSFPGGEYQPLIAAMPTMPKQMNCIRD